MIATNFQISNTHDGYIVSAFVYTSAMHKEWKPLRNFGDRQSDALIFLHEDCPQLSETSISLLVKNYKVEYKYKRVSARRFVRLS